MNSPHQPVHPTQDERVDVVLAALSRTQAPGALAQRVLDRLAQHEATTVRTRWAASMASPLPWRLAALTATLALIAFVVPHTRPRRVAQTGRPLPGNASARFAGGQLPGQLRDTELHGLPHQAVRLASALPRSTPDRVDPAFLPSLAPPPQALTPQERRLAIVLRSQGIMQLASLHDDSDPAAALRHVRYEPALFAGFSARPEEPAIADPSTPAPDPQLAEPEAPTETPPRRP